MPARTLTIAVLLAQLCCAARAEPVAGVDLEIWRTNLPPTSSGGALGQPPARRLEARALPRRVESVPAVAAATGTTRVDVPPALDAQFSRAVRLADAGRVEDALLIAQALCAAPGATEHCWRTLARIQARGGAHRRAVESLRRVAALSRDAAIQSELGAALASLGLSDDAVDAGAEAVRRDPREVDALVGLARRLTESAPEAALRAYRAALQVAPAHAEALLGAGRLLARSGDAEASALLERAVAAAPSAVPARLELGRALEAQGRSSDAVTQFRAAAAARDGTTAPWQLLAGALERAGRATEAIGAYRDALAVAPGWREGWLALADALRKAGRAPEADAAAQKARALE